jgi:hypothetical protein
MPTEKPSRLKFLVMPAAGRGGRPTLPMALHTARKRQGRVTPGPYAVQLGGGTRSAATFRA